MEYKTISRYRIYSNGTVYSLIRNKELKPHKTTKGYHAVKIDGVPTPIHRLVAIAFIPNPENKPQVNHINGIKTDNRLENLEWCTQSENSKHSFKIGLQCNKGENHPNAKITLSQSKEIKQLIQRGGISQRDIAKKYNVSPHLVFKIKNGETWNY